MLRSLGILCAAALLTLAAGCGGSPPESAKPATVSEAKAAAPAPAATPAPAAAPAPAPSPESAPAAAPEAAPAPAAAAPAAGAKTYQIIADADHYDCSISFTGYKPLGQREGGFRAFKGVFTMPGDAPEAGQVTVDIDTTSIYSDSDMLTGVLKSDAFFNLGAHPAAKFTSTKIEKAADGSYTVTGDLALRGVTKSVQFPAKIAAKPDGVKVDAEFTIDRSQWSIGADTWQDQAIKNEVLLKLDILAVPAA